jgi:hypothetical protein
LFFLHPIPVSLPKTLNSRIERQNTQQEHRLIQWRQKSDSAATHFYIQNVETYCQSYAATERALAGKALMLADELASIKLIDSVLHLRATASAPSAQ